MLHYNMWTLLGSIVALKPIEFTLYIYKGLGYGSMHNTLFVGLYFKSGKLLELGALCHGLHHCINGVVAHWLATTCSMLAYKWRLCFFLNIVLHS